MAHKEHKKSWKNYAALYVCMVTSCVYLHAMAPKKVDDAASPFYVWPLTASNFTSKAQRGDAVYIKAAIENNFDISQPDTHGNTALNYAVNRQKVEVARLLVEARANLEAPSAAFGTPFYTACRHGNMELVKLLVDAGADVNYKHTNGTNGLNAAGAGGHDDIVKFLLDTTEIDSTQFYKSEHAGIVAAAKKYKDQKKDTAQNKRRKTEHSDEQKTEQKKD